MQIAEWPGGEPQVLSKRADDIQTKALRKGASYIPLTSTKSKLSSDVMLPWGSRVNFEAASESWTIVTGPAYVRRGMWQLEVIGEALVAPHGVRRARKQAEMLLRQGYGVRRSNERIPRA